MWESVLTLSEPLCERHSAADRPWEPTADNTKHLSRLQSTCFRKLWIQGRSAWGHIIMLTERIEPWAGRNWQCRSIRWVLERLSAWKLLVNGAENTKTKIVWGHTVCASLSSRQMGAGASLKSREKIFWAESIQPWRITAPAKASSNHTCP